MIKKVFSEVSGDASKTLAGMGAPLTGVQASVVTGTLTGGTLTVSASLDDVHFDPIASLAFNAADMTAKAIKLATGGFPFYKLELKSIAWVTTGTIDVVMNS